MMHAHVRHQGQGWQPCSMVGDGGWKACEERRWRLKRLKPQRIEIVEEMEVERRNKEISGERGGERRGGGLPMISL